MTKRVFSFHYTLTDTNGQVLDSSREGAPLSFLEGMGQIIPGLEEVLLGLVVGDKKNVTIPSDKAYGARVDELVVPLPRQYFPDTVAVGQVYEIDAEEGAVPAIVLDINEKVVTVDANHALAGQDLTFDVEMTEIRTATEEELAHGHVHGPGGHHH